MRAPNHLVQAKDFPGGDQFMQKGLPETGMDHQRTESVG